MKRIAFLLLTAAIGVALIVFISSFNKIEPKKKDKPKISFTFDDGSTKDFNTHKLEVWNQLLLSHLEKHRVKAILFSSGQNKRTEKGKYVLSSWNDSGHKIANHTFSHPNFNKASLSDFKLELLRNDSIIKPYSNYFPYFRFPYLKEGDTPEKVIGFRNFLKENGYKNGHVTIDASDWYIDSRLVKRISEDPNADISGFKDYYKKHLFDRALFYDSLAYELTNRRIHHVMLLHHNLSAALFMDDLIQHFKDRGWEVVDAIKAYEDDVYKTQPETVPAGESLIWAMAKSSGKYDNVLRYPAEDSKYEKPAMDSLGL